MKKLLLTLLALIPLLSFSQDTLVKWTFPNNPDDSIADGGTTANLPMFINTHGGTSAITFTSTGATTRSASATKWNTGNLTKYWQVKVVTLGYSNIALSSKQYSSGTGPAHFKAQYSTDYSATWNDFAGNVVTVATNFTTGSLAGVTLPSDCDNKDTVYIRWIMTSDTAVSGALVGSAGSSRIDNIFISGHVSSLLPAKQLFVASVNNGVSPFINAPFNVVVHALDSTGMVSNVTSNTNITLALVTGNGTLSGVLTGTIMAGAYSCTFSGLTYHPAETGVSIKVTDDAALLTADTSALFTILDSLPPPSCNVLSDDFSDGDFTANPAWTDMNVDTLFKVTAGELQSNGPHSNGNTIADTIMLSTPISLVMTDSITWSFLVDLKFNPTSDNIVRVYLVSDNANLKNVLNGYYIEMGQTSADNIKLFKVNAGVSTLLFTGSTSFASNIKARIKVVKSCSASGNKWSVSSDAAGGTNYVSEGSPFAENSIFSAAYYGVYCSYKTDSRYNQYYFDDFCISSDTCGCDSNAPTVDSVVVVNAGSLNVYFSEPVDPIIAGNPANYTVNTIDNPASVTMQTGNTVASLTFVPDLPFGASTICINNIQDLCFNVMTQYCGPITILVPECNTFSDDFSDGDFTSNPIWTDLGVDSLFKVNAGELESNGGHTNGNTVADSMMLSTPVSTYITCDSTIKWSFLLDLKFNPTVDNFVRVYLVSDHPDLNNSLNGYYIEMGQVGNDNIKFYKQTGTLRTLIFTDTASFSGNVKARIQIIRNNLNVWQIFSDKIGGTNYAHTGTFSENTFHNTSYIGVFCRYKTDSRYNEYNFDDFCIQTINCSGITESQTFANIVIAPNPVQDYFYIYNLNTAAEIQLYDMLGNLMQIETTAENSAVKVNTGNIARGIYLLMIRDAKNNGLLSKRIVKF